MLPDVAAPVQTRTAKCDGVMPVLIGAQHRAHGDIGARDVMRGDLIEYAVADKTVVGIQGNDYRLGIAALVADRFDGIGKQTLSGAPLQQRDSP